MSTGPHIFGNAQMEHAQRQQAMMEQLHLNISAGIFQQLAVMDYARAKTELDERIALWKMGSQEGSEPADLDLKASSMANLAGVYAGNFLQTFFSKPSGE